jgi:hypothetical protein
LATAKRGSVVKKGLKFFNFGEAGTWKSSFALNMAKLKSEDGKPLRVLYIDCEAGSVDNYLEDLQDEGVNLNNILLVYTTSYSEVEEWATKAMNDEDLFVEGENGDLEIALDADGNPFRADVIVVDGITVISDNVKFAAINVSEKRAKLKAKAQERNATEQFVGEATAGLEFKDHDKIKMKGKNLLRSLITGTDKYVVVTSREKTKKVMQKSGDKMELVEVGKVPDTWDGAEYEFFTVLRHFEDEDGSIKAQVIRKDRTKVFAQNEIIENPTPLYWQSVIDGNKGKNSNILKGTVEDDVHKDEDIIAKGINSDKDEPEEKLVTVEDYRKKISNVIKSLSTPKKKALKPKVEKAGIDSDFNNIEDIEVLQKFLDLITE